MSRIPDADTFGFRMTRHRHAVGVPSQYGICIEPVEVEYTDTVYVLHFSLSLYGFRIVFYSFRMTCFHYAEVYGCRMYRHGLAEGVSLLYGLLMILDEDLLTESVFPLQVSMQLYGVRIGRPEFRITPISDADAYGVRNN